jgi:hypothetical protein
MIAVNSPEIWRACTKEEKEAYKSEDYTHNFK